MLQLGWFNFKNSRLSVVWRHTWVLATQYAMRQMRHKHCPYKQSGETESDISTFHKTGTLWIFAIVLSVVTILKYLAIVQQRKFATTHIFTFYIDVWYLIVTQAENTTSVATVGTVGWSAKSDAEVSDYILYSKQMQRTVKDDQIRLSKCRPLAFTQAHQLKIRSLQRMLGTTWQFSCVSSVQRTVCNSEFLRTTLL